MHAPGRYAFVPVEGPGAFEFGATMHVSGGASVLDEIRPSVSPFYFLAGPLSGGEVTAVGKGHHRTGVRVRRHRPPHGSRSLR